MPQSLPVVLSISGHDPSGGAGIQADIEAITRQGCHACSVITALTTQNTAKVKTILPQPADLVTDQINFLMEDVNPDAIKIGLIGSGEIADSLYRIILKYPKIPLVIDPVLAAGTGEPFANPNIISALIDLLIPKATLVTPNSIEARVLAPKAANLDDCGRQLVASGCPNVLITGTHENQKDVINTLYNDSGIVNSQTWERLDASYHGSGCTLASCIAAMIALGHDPAYAATQSQRYTWQSLVNGYQPGQGQYVPRRISMMESE